MFDFKKIYFPQDKAKAWLLLLALGLVYLPFINNPLIFDDLPFFAGALGFADAPFELSLRWFPYVSIGVTAVFAENSPPIFHLQNLLIHGLNVLMLLLLMRLWIVIFIEDESKLRMAKWGAWLGALIFAVHPLAVYGVSYLVQRSILMATLFTLLLYVAYLRALLENKKRYLLLAVAAYFLAVFSKEHSIMAPALLMLLTWVMRERIQLPLRMLVATWFSFFVIAIVVVLKMKGLLGVAYEPDAGSMFGQQEMLQGMAAPHLFSVLTQAGLFFKYLLLMWVPNPAWMSIDMRETFILDASDGMNWLGVLAFIAYGVFSLCGILKGGRFALLGVAMLYPWLLFMTEFSSVRVQEVFVLYRAYLWMPGMMLMVPLMVSALPEKRTMWMAVLVAMLLIPLSWNRLWVMADDHRLWDDAVKLLHGEDKLGAQRTYYNRARASAALKNWDDAIRDYQKSLAIDQSHLQVNLALAGTYVNAQRYKEALIEYEGVIQRDGKNAQAYYGKAFVLSKQNDKAGAEVMLKKSCDLGYNMACMLLNWKPPHQP